jgi:hypothetical protein
VHRLGGGVAGTRDECFRAVGRVRHGTGEPMA